MTGADTRPPGLKRDDELTCTYCGETYHKACMHCHRPGVPYEYRGQTFDGLTAIKGEWLCSGCRDQKMEAEGVDITVDDRTGYSYTTNSVRDRDVVHVFLPPELRGVDGRDMARRGRRRTGG